MDYKTITAAVDNRSRVKVTDRAGTHKGLVGIALGYRAQYHNMKVGMIDAQGNYTGDYTMVPVDCLEIVQDESAEVRPEAGLGVALANVSAGLDALLVETEAAIPAPITDRHGVTWEWKTGNVFRDPVTGRAWPRDFIELPV